MDTRKLKIKWTAVYETTVELPSFSHSNVEEETIESLRSSFESIPGAKITKDSWKILSKEDIKD